MSKGKSTISKAQSYKEIGDFWDTHDLTDYWEQTHPAEFQVDVQSEVIYYALDASLSEEVCSIAKRRGVPPETLVNLWVQEKLEEEIPENS
jgi:hypothetical protein